VLHVSYSPAGEDWARWIAWELEGAGCRVVLQAWDFAPGTNFTGFTDRGVTGAAAAPAGGNDRGPGGRDPGLGPRDGQRFR